MKNPLFFHPSFLHAKVHTGLSKCWGTWYVNVLHNSGIEEVDGTKHFSQLLHDHYLLISTHLFRSFVFPTGTFRLLPVYNTVRFGPVATLRGPSARNIKSR